MGQRGLVNGADSQASTNFQATFSSRKVNGVTEVFWLHGGNWQIAAVNL